MTSETDYSIHPTVGAREIPGLRPASDRSRRRRSSRRGKKGRRQDAPDGDAVEVDLTGEQVNAPDPDADKPKDPPEKPAVDYLA
ncbi:MAG TPA: hypothetical protein VM031_07115 [Phycisphaerae bacterium]|nr:hypothetical protein [Phycisphaerae bacterium]